MVVIYMRIIFNRRKFFKKRAFFKEKDRVKWSKQNDQQFI